MIFDPYYLLMVVLPGLLISGIASWMVQAAFKKYSQVPNRRGITGAQAAQMLLDHAGIHDVEIVPVQGFLSDHYHPVHKRLALSPEVFHGRSVAAVGVATHEAGHAIQHARNYFPLYIRSSLVPAVGIGSMIGNYAMLFGFMMINAPIGKTILLVGALALGVVMLFQLVTLPVEFNATNRAKRLVLEAGIIDASERVGMDRVLNAAAMTYVAAAIQTTLTVAYMLLRAFGSRNND
jgi:uncharacterized protein